VTAKMVSRGKMRYSRARYKGFMVVQHSNVAFDRVKGSIEAKEHS
jgi:hypothetical protein